MTAEGKASPSGGTMQRFGEKLHILRTRHGMTLRELTQALGYNVHSYIGDIETGKTIPRVDCGCSGAAGNMGGISVLLPPLFIPLPQTLRQGWPPVGGWSGSMRK